MGEITHINISAFGSRLSPAAFAVFSTLYENARNTIIKQGPIETYEKPLAELINESGSRDVETVANSIREIIQRRVECKEGDYQIFFPFLKSISIENGIIRYSLPREIESSISRIPVPGSC